MIKTLCVCQQNRAQDMQRLTKEQQDMVAELTDHARRRSGYWTRLDIHERQSDAMLALCLAAPHHDPARGTWRQLADTAISNQLRSRVRHHRRHRRHYRQHREEWFEEFIPAPEPDQCSPEEVSMLRQCIGELMPEQRDVMACRMHGMPLAQIAEIAGVPVGTVKSRYHAAVKQLRKLMGVAA